MKTIIFSAHNFEKQPLIDANAGKHELIFLEIPLKKETVYLAKDADAISIFVNDDASEDVLKILEQAGIKYIALRSAGFNHVNLDVAKKLQMRLARVSAYSPYAVAEHAVTLMLALNRNIVRANSRVRDLNFSLENLTGFDMHNKTVGIIGTGEIGAVAARILHGFGCKILAIDLVENTELKEKYGVVYTDHTSLYNAADIITLHLPLTPESHYMINSDSLNKMKQGVMLINTSRGALVNTKDVIKGLKTGKIGYLGLDVYEQEGGLFFEDHSDHILQDDTISRLLTFKNVLITSHQAFLTETALKNIAETTIHNLTCFEDGTPCENEI